MVHTYGDFLLDPDFFTLALKDDAGEVYSLKYPGVTLYSDCGKALAVVQFTAKHVATAVAERPSPEAHCQLFQGLAKEDGAKISFVFTNLSDKWEMCFNCTRKNKRINEISVLLPRHSVEVCSDYSNENRKMILGVLESKLTVKQDEETASAIGAPKKGEYVEFSIFPQAYVGADDFFRSTRWKTSNFVSIAKKPSDLHVALPSTTVKVQSVFGGETIPSAISTAGYKTKCEQEKPQESKIGVQDDEQRFKDKILKMRVESRRAYVTKREREKLEALKFEIMDEEFMFKDEPLTFKEKAQLDLKRKIIEATRAREEVLEMCGCPSDVKMVEQSYKSPKEEEEEEEEEEDSFVGFVGSVEDDDFSPPRRTDHVRSIRQSESHRGRERDRDRVRERAMTAPPCIDDVLNSLAVEMKHGDVVDVKSKVSHTQFNKDLPSRRCTLGLSVQVNLKIMPRQSKDAVRAEATEFLQNLQKNRFSEFLAAPKFVESECLVCMDAQTSVLFFSCGHQVVCDGCASKLTDNKCIVCRTNVRAMLHMRSDK